MLILEKKSNIKTLYNIGLDFNQIKRIFFFEGMLINLIGGLSGIILGIIICLLQQQFGLLRLEGGIVEFYPVKINPAEIVYILATVLVIGFISSWIPIQRLSRKTI
jgi:lipoprotein-releasing system permease protein